jgi:hypothetical protein
MTDLTPDSERAIVCKCGSVSFALRGDGLCECVSCGKTGLYQWERFGTNGNNG